MSRWEETTGKLERREGGGHMLDCVVFGADQLPGLFLGYDEKKLINRNLI